MPRPQIQIGCSGWFYWGWRDIFYPSEVPTQKWFSRYLQTFRTVELNAPFYKWPRAATVRTWKRQAPRSFKYSIKVNWQITHERRFVRTKKLVNEFYGIADVLGPQMGCFLFQFPPSFRYSAAALRRIVAQLDPKHRNVVEFRHRSWWNEKVYQAFRDAGIIFCCVSAPRLPDDVVRTAEDIYVRLHGVKQWYRHDYSRQELDHWAQRICASGASRGWIYFDNDRSGFAIKNALELMRLLRCRRCTGAEEVISKISQAALTATPWKPRGKPRDSAKRRFREAMRRRRGNPSTPA